MRIWLVLAFLSVGMVGYAAAQDCPATHYPCGGGVCCSR